MPECRLYEKRDSDTGDIVLVSLLLTLNIFTPCSIVCVVNFEQVISGWDMKVLESLESFSSGLDMF